MRWGEKFSTVFYYEILGGTPMKKFVFIILAVCILFAPAASVDASSRKIKEEIVFAQSADLTTMNPCYGTQERAFSLTNHMYDTLLTYDSDMKVQFALAESYEWLDDLRLQFNLRKNVKFHNGDVLTAKDVVFSFEQRAIRGGGFTTYIDVNKLEIVDDNTLIVHFSTPHPSFIYQLTDPGWGIMPKDYFEAHGAEYFASHPIGCGPYKMKEYVTGDHYTLERFDDYWGGPAKTKYLTMKIVPEAGQRTILLETGGIDVAYEIPYIDIDKIKDNPDLQFLSTPSMKIVMFYVNTQSSTPLKNKLVRQAMEYAIDKQLIVDSLLYGYGKVAYAVVPDVAIEYKEVKVPHVYNLEKAKALMAEAGYPDGFETEIWTSAIQDYSELSQIVQDQLADINIKAKVLVQDANTIDSRLNAGDEYGMSLHFYSCNSGHVEFTLSNILPTGMLRNSSRFSNADYDEAYYKWLVTTDEAERDVLLTRMFEIQNEETPVIPIYNERKVLGATKNIEGIQLSRIGAHEYQNAVVYVE